MKKFILLCILLFNAVLGFSQAEIILSGSSGSGNNLGNSNLSQTDSVRVFSNSGDRYFGFNVGFLDLVSRGDLRVSAQDDIEIGTIDSILHIASNHRFYSGGNDRLLIDNQGVKVQNTTVDNTVTELYGKGSNGQIVEVNDVFDRTVTEVATYTDINVSNFPNPVSGQLIKVADTGAVYKFQDTAVTGYNGGAADGIAVIAVGSKFAVLQADKGEVYIDHFGSTITNTLFNKALEFSTGRTLVLGEKTYDSQTTNSVPSDITIKGTRGKSILIGVLNIGADNNNITIEGITFQVPAATVWAHGIRIPAPTVTTTGDITIRDCDFIDAIIFSDAVTATTNRGTGLLIENCTFYLDAEGQSSVNPISVYMNDMEIRGCSFETLDADQSIKIAEGGGYCRVINNKFIGRHLEEVIDGYSFEGEIVFSYNEVDISSGGIYRSKPGAVTNPKQYPYPRRLEVSHNQIRERGNGSNLIYAAGAFTLGAEDSIQTVIVSDNIIQSDTTNGAINIRGYHQAVVSNNTISASNYAFSGIGAVAVGNLSINGNIIDGKVSVLSGNTPAGEAYNNNYNGIIEISNNLVNSDTSNFAIRVYQQNVKSISFKNNTVIFDKSNAQYAFRLEDLTVDDVMVVGNVVNIQGNAPSTANQIEYGSATITNYTEVSNSFTTVPWTPLGNDIKSSPTSGNSVIIGTLDGTGVQESLEVGGNIASSNGYILGAGTASEIGKWYNTSGKNILGGINRDWVINNATDNYVLFDASNKALALSTEISGVSSFKEPDNKAILDLESTTKGILIPRMTTIQKTTITGVNGLLVYDTDLGRFEYHNGTTWVGVGNDRLTYGTEVTTTATAIVGEILPVDCSGGTITINDPTTANAGDRFVILDSSASSATNNITVDFNGSTFYKVANGTDTISTDGAYITYEYINATIGWVRQK